MQKSSLKHIWKMTDLIKKLLSPVWIAVLISIISLLFSVYSYNRTINLQKKYDSMSTYEMALNYEVEISEKNNCGCIDFDDIKIHRGQISVVPKTGGIESIYVMHYYKGNVKGILNTTSLKKIDNYDANQVSHVISEYTVDNIAQSKSVYFGTLYLLIKDYKNNYYTNMIVYEIEKKKTSNIKTRVYSDIDLLNNYNKTIDVLPEFDKSQMKEYQSLNNKLKKILN